MSTEQNKELVLRWKDEIWNRRNLNVIDELYAEDCVFHLMASLGPVQGRVALKQVFAAYFAAFETHETPDFLVAEGDLVAMHDTYWAKSVGPFRGVPPTGQEATLAGTDIYRIANGRFVEQWFDADFTPFMQQLGVVPGPG